MKHLCIYKNDKLLLACQKEPTEDCLAIKIDDKELYPILVSPSSYNAATLRIKINDTIKAFSFRYATVDLFLNLAIAATTETPIDLGYYAAGGVYKYFEEKGIYVITSNEPNDRSLHPSWSYSTGGRYAFSKDGIHWASFTGYFFSDVWLYNGNIYGLFWRYAYYPNSQDSYIMLRTVIFSGWEGGYNEITYSTFGENYGIIDISDVTCIEHNTNKKIKPLQYMITDNSGTFWFITKEGILITPKTSLENGSQLKFSFASLGWRFKRIDYDNGEAQLCFKHSNTSYKYVNLNYYKSVNDDVIVWGDISETPMYDTSLMLPKSDMIINGLRNCADGFYNGHTKVAESGARSVEGGLVYPTVSFNPITGYYYWYWFNPSNTILRYRSKNIDRSDIELDKQIEVNEQQSYVNSNICMLSSSVNTYFNYGILELS